MYQYWSRQPSPTEPFATLHYGIFENHVKISSKTRRYLVFVPDGARASTSGVFVLGANGQSADDLLENSGWRELAENDKTKEKLIVYFLEPENGTWKTDEPYGKVDGDVAYVNAVYHTRELRFQFCVHESRCYLYGEREGGTMAHMAAMFNPAGYAGIVSVNANDVKESYRGACGRDHCTELNGFMDLQKRLRREKGLVPMPVWLIGNRTENSGTKHYWCQATGTDPMPDRVSSDTIVYKRTVEPEYPLNQELAAYEVWVTGCLDATRHTPVRAWYDFLSRHHRWMADPCGDLRMKKDPIGDLGMEYHYEDIDGWMREWYVYVPESVRRSPFTPVPLVFAIHGYSCTGDIYINNSQWYRVADDNQFIVIFPTATPGNIFFKTQASDPDNMPLPAWNFLHNAPNGPNELVFFKTVLKNVCAAYAVDRSRVFVTGHSHGAMMTHALAMALPDIFTAAAPCSGSIFDLVYDSVVQMPEITRQGNIVVPVWMFVGTEEEWLMPAQPRVGNASAKTIQLWCERNGAAIPQEADFENNWTTHDKRWHDRTFPDAKKLPVVRYTIVDDLPHATMTEMSYRIWDEFFSHWTRKNHRIYWR